MGKAQIITALMLVVIGFLQGCSTVGQDVPGIANFAEVEKGLYRGGQPGKLGFDELSRRGVNTVINLRDDAWPNEGHLVEQAGMNYVHIGTNAAYVEPGKIERFLTAVTTAPRPIFVHCKMGRDRTGLEIAMYRIMVQGWSRENALRELYAHGYNWMLYPAIARHLRTFAPPVETVAAAE